MWKISETAVQGRSHIENNIPCQDKVFSLTKNGVTSVALADGAGSAKLSHYGAEATVKIICEKLCSDFYKFVNSKDPISVRTSILDCILENLEKVSDKINCGLYDLSSTLLAAASDNENVIMLHIGDGVIGYFKNGNLIVASEPDNGEFANETTFVTSRDALQRMRLKKGNAKEISGFVLMSDGTAKSLFDSQEKKFVPLVEEIRQRTIMYPEDENNNDLNELFTEVIRNNITRDDCSMIMMCRPDEHFRGYRDLEDYDKYLFLGVRTSEGKKNREKIFEILANSDKEYVSRSQIIKTGCENGLKRRQTTGLLRELDKNDLIERTFPRKYKLKFPF